MALNIRTYLERISPPWLRRKWGSRYVATALGLPLDIIAEGLGEATKAPWLKSDTSPDDALPSIGNERRMPRYAVETSDVYRERLWQAWDTWLFAGSELAVSTQLTASGQVGFFVWPAENADARTSRPAWQFEFPADHANWSRFVVELHNTGHQGDTWGAGTWGEVGTWGGTATVNEVAAIRDIARRWSSGHEINPYIVVVISGEIWGPGGNAWGSGTWGGEAIKWDNQ